MRSLKRLAAALAACACALIANASEVGGYPTAGPILGPERMLADQAGLTVDITPALLGQYFFPIIDSEAALSNKPAVTSVCDATCGNLTLSGAQTIDSVACSVGVSVELLTAQTTASQNGPWVCQSGAWTRPTWYPTAGTLQAFQFAAVHVRLGGVYAGSFWDITTSGAITIDTTATTWSIKPIALDNLTVSGTGCNVSSASLFFATNGTCQAGGGGGNAFSGIVSGTNTSAAMVCGTGCSLGTAGSGTITATNAVEVNGAAVPASASVIGTNSSRQFVSQTTTGTGNNVLATSPTLVTPALGTPSAAVLTNATGLPLSGLVSQAANTFLANNTGSSAAPTAISVATTQSALAIPCKVDVKVFATAGTQTWTKPASCGSGAAQVTWVKACGSGGGAGSGAVTASGTANSGGGGGGGGGCTEWTAFATASLGSTESVVVGAAGSGGASVSSGAGNNGTNGNTSSFGTTPWISAFGGCLGTGGASGAISSGGGGGGLAIPGFGCSGTVGGVNAGTGGAGSQGGASGGDCSGAGGGGTPSGGAGTLGGVSRCAPGGGSGGGVSTSPTAQAGGGAGSNPLLTGANGAGICTVGAAGAASASGYSPGSAGAGGGGCTTGNAGGGGNGIQASGGGGGGGAVGNASGAGGNGGAGYVVAITTS
jgi:hypothetical protein